MTTISIRAMLLQMAGLTDTSALTDWENTFLKDVLERTGQAKHTSSLSEAQVEKVSEIFRKHIAS